MVGDRTAEVEQIHQPAMIPSPNGFRRYIVTSKLNAPGNALN
jgi:hypothetical protein